MSVLVSRFPVHTLDNQQLLPAGAEVSGETLDALISSRVVFPCSSTGR